MPTSFDELVLLSPCGKIKAVMDWCGEWRSDNAQSGGKLLRIDFFYKYEKGEQYPPKFADCEKPSLEYDDGDWMFVRNGSVLTCLTADMPRDVLETWLSYALGRITSVLRSKQNPKEALEDIAVEISDLRRKHVDFVPELGVLVDDR